MTGPLHVICSGCGWWVVVVVSDPLVPAIAALDGWTVTPGEPVLCERCSTGWRPQHPPPAIPDPAP